MARTFDIPVFYRSPIISVVKNARKLQDPRRTDYAPSVLDFGPIVFRLARHFGFCFGVENAIEIAYRAVEQHPDKRIFLLSEMIHNPHVNNDLRRRGVQFMMTTSGQQLVGWDDLSSDDIVIVPAFGTTLEIQQQLSQRGIDPYATTPLARLSRKSGTAPQRLASAIAPWWCMANGTTKKPALRSATAEAARQRWWWKTWRKPNGWQQSLKQKKGWKNLKNGSGTEALKGSIRPPI